ncbi:hypothetical protein [Kordia sp.]|uniref:hypothetical protein n=1 Tax=Kordia sp. TaxID=1965332 RepID=UPI003D6BF073
MQKIVVILFYLSSCHVFGQRDMKVITEDFNNDKIVDTLKTFYEGGSGFGGRYVQIINGKTNEMHQLTNEGCFCRIKSTILIPPKLAKKENVLFLEIMKTHLLPEKRKHPEASLNWMIKSAYSNANLDTNDFFDLIVDPQTSWIEEEFEAPDNYYIEIKGDSLRQVYTTPYEAPEWLDAKNARGFLMYYAHNHYRSRTRDSIKLSDSNATYKVYNTSHGVFVKKGNTYKWVFISDASITGAPSKLRWESIKKIQLYGKYVLIQQIIPPYNMYKIFIINIETGICGRLKHDFSDSNNATIDDVLQGEIISLDIEGKQVKYELKTIFKELEKQYLTKKTSKKHN